MQKQKRKSQTPKRRKTGKNEMSIEIREGEIKVDGKLVGTIERNLKDGTEPYFLCSIGETDKWFKEGTSPKVVVDYITEIVNNLDGGG